MHTTSAEGFGIDIKVAVSYRPIVAELWELDTEIGPNFYEEVVVHEFRTAARGVFARHSYVELQQMNEKIEDEIESELHRRLAGKHVEISSVTMEQVEYSPEIVNAFREKQDAIRRGAAQENEARQRRVALEHEAEQAKLRQEAAMREKHHDHAIAEEQAAIDRVRAEQEAASRVTRARAEAEEVTLLAKARAEQKRAETATLTPLAVMMHAYDALAKLGGEGTTILLGDWSHVPSFLFPKVGAFQNLVGAPPSAPLNTSARR